MSEQSIKMGGRGSAFSKDGLNNNAYIKEGNSLTFIDISQKNLHAYMNTDMFEGVDNINVVITHTHGDHVSGLGDLGLYSYFSISPNFQNKLNVYAPKEITEDVQTQMRISGCTEENYNISEMPEKEFTKVGNAEFKPIPVEHVAVLSSFAFEIKKDDKLIYYSGDSNMIPEDVLEKQKSGKYDEFYQDACIADYPGNVHLHINKLGELLSRENRDNVFLMHLDPGFPPVKAEVMGFKIVDTLLDEPLIHTKEAKVSSKKETGLEL